MYNWIINSKWKLENEISTLPEKNIYLKTHSKQNLAAYINDYCDNLVSKCKELEEKQQDFFNYSELATLEAGVPKKHRTTGGSNLKPPTSSKSDF